ncbi:peroxiredoxin family protein [Dyadobacter sandarakinus]|uniref:TlpA family protein disulfide reductase n=1 Tax=Dyadobacter sandarakinus TaxID=2747268 RepID=A0ABX7IB97_9BACT|nr:TlpA disulfide reductase family protein [Dyadobacter sandarakinus]QRR02797.1 TlpA family protein disulfide reductase [Dyadobacter sandarakinus]
MRLLHFLAGGLISLAVWGCGSSQPEVKEGTWRATLTREGNKLPLLLEINKNTDGKSYSAFAINGEEKLQMDSLYFQNDSLVIPMQLFDAKIVAKVDKDRMTGLYYRVPNGIIAGSLPFEATHGENYKFYPKGTAKASRNVTGNWATTFKNEVTGDTTLAVGSFRQDGSDVTGSFLTPTGDYRFLTGSVNGDSLYLSTFDGSNAMLFKAAVQSDGSIKGAMWSGLKGYKTFVAKADSAARLPDATKLTFLKPGFDTVDFTFSDADGKQVSLKDPRFKGKPVIIQIMGSWCPNCMDETNFLAPWYSKNKDRGVEIVGLAFERSDKPEVSNPKIKRMVSRFNIEYPVLLAGTNTDEATSKALPALNKVMSYPTTIFIDKKGKVREIHTGFSGPGTGKYYDEFVADFNGLMDKLIAEK